MIEMDNIVGSVSSTRASSSIDLNDPPQEVSLNCIVMQTAFSLQMRSPFSICVISFPTQDPPAPPPPEDLAIVVLHNENYYEL